jgi:hypothetical protein
MIKLYKKKLIKKSKLKKKSKQKHVFLSHTKTFGKNTIYCYSNFLKCFAVNNN